MFKEARIVEDAEEKHLRALKLVLEDTEAVYMMSRAFRATMGAAPANPPQGILEMHQANVKRLRETLAHAERCGAQVVEANTAWRSSVTVRTPKA